ncbi:MAG: hypothetical protein QM613_03525 [Micrococcaceae bacterium]
MEITGFINELDYLIDLIKKSNISLTIDYSNWKSPAANLAGELLDNHQHKLFEISYKLLSLREQLIAAKLLIGST